MGYSPSPHSGALHMPKTLDDALKTLRLHAEQAGPAEVRTFDALGAHFASVARELEALRREQGLSQRALAKASRVDQAEVSRILSGVTEPRIGTAQKLARALGATIGVLRPLSGSKVRETVVVAKHGRAPLATKT